MSFLKNALSNFLDGGASQAQSKNEASFAYNQQLLNTQHGLGMGWLQQVLAQNNEGFADAKANLANAGQSATNQILAGQEKTLAGNKQSLISKGLGSTTLGANLANQTQGQTNTALAGLAENIGAQNAGLTMQHTANQASGLQSLAQFAMSKVGAQNAITPQYTSSGGGLLGGLGSALGQFAGSYGSTYGKLLADPDGKTTEKK